MNLALSLHLTKSAPASAWIAAGVCFFATPAFGHHLEKHFTVDGHSVVTIHNPNGKITIHSWNKPEVMVSADHNSDRVEVDATQEGNRIDLVTHTLANSVTPEEFEANYQISVPQDAELQIHDDSGTVTVSNVLGDMNVETVAAGVDLQDAAGYLTIKTVGGSFQCVRCAGHLDVSSISGNFRLIDLRSNHVHAQTSKGNILFDGQFLPNGNYFLKNYSGDITVRFSPGDSFDLSATSYKGKVNTQAQLTPPAQGHHFWHPKFGNSLFGSLNLGRAKVDLSSFDGTINILKRD
jgi:DUF4097 and DUF4098 domain-containing protein YvlB